MWKVGAGAVVNEDELVSRPGGIVHVNGKIEAVEALETQDVTASSFQEERISKEDMENALGTPAVVRGVTPSRQETATEVVTKNSSAGFRFDAKVLLFESLGMKRAAYLMDLNNQQFISEARVVRLFGPAGLEWKRVEPYELQGEYDYQPAASSVDPMVNKELRRQQLNEILPVAMQNPYIKQLEFTRMWLHAYDIRAVDKFLKTEEEVAEEQAMAQQQALVQAQVAGQGGKPGKAGGDGDAL
jgi:hypothetical protein